MLTAMANEFYGKRKFSEFFKFSQKIFEGFMRKFGIFKGFPFVFMFE